MQPYAAKTRVHPDQTRQEIVTLLRKAGATKVAPMSDYETGREHLIFELATRRIRFSLRMPLPDDATIALRSDGSQRPAKEAKAHLEQLTRSKWRGLLLLLRAKLEAVRDGTVTIEDEFLANTVMPDGRTVGEWAKGQIDRAITEGHMPPLLPSGE